MFLELQRLNSFVLSSMLFIDSCSVIGGSIGGGSRVGSCNSTSDPVMKTTPSPSPSICGMVGCHAAITTARPLGEVAGGSSGSWRCSLSLVGVDGLVTLRITPAASTASFLVDACIWCTAPAVAVAAAAGLEAAAAGLAAAVAVSVAVEAVNAA
jgi:hypothetical protein